jgi:hypothetical protein
MRRFYVIVGFCIFIAGCAGGAPDEHEDMEKDKDMVAVFEAVLRQEVGEQKHVANVYLSIDGKDPSKAMLEKFVKKFPTLQPRSKAPQGNATQVSLSDLKWIDRNTAEVNGGFSNGMDGRHSLYRVVRKQGEWIVEKAEIKAIS